jgi:chemotaxis signal transduction protein
VYGLDAVTLCTVHALEFGLDGSRYAVPLPRVLEVLPRVWLTPLPAAPPHVGGIFAYRGELAVVVDPAVRLGHVTPRVPRVSDYFIMTRGARWPIAVVADQITGVRALPEEAMAASPLENAPVAGVVVLSDGILLVDHLDALLSFEEEVETQRGIDAANA